jgi:hypothetical protein
MEDNIPKVIDDSTLTDNNSAFIQVALDIAEERTRSRAGFGAFRHYRDICRDTLSIVFESGFFADVSHEQAPYHLIDEEMLWAFYRLKGKGKLNFKYFFESVLTTPSSYSPSCVWALFWALAKAEHEFLVKYIPYWSHEERLTGHLVSQVITRLEDFEPYWARLDASSQDEDKSHCRIHYVDTATARNEKITGADLGLIIQVKLPRQQEYFKVARFQAKKVNKKGDARIDLSQTAAMLKKDSLGYYLFYHSYDSAQWSLAPTVCSASKFKYDVENSRKEKQAIKIYDDSELGEKYFPVINDGWDFAAFVTFALADQASEHGVFSTSAEEGIRELMSSDKNLPSLSRILVVTLGAQATELNWDNLLREYVSRGDLQ